MRSFVNIVLAALAACPVILATQHTLCYNYFLKKDGCVFGAADNRIRCDPYNGKPPKRPVGRFEKQRPFQHHKRDEQSLDRRYTTKDTNTSFPIQDGPGICGDYKTNEDAGACLWVGPEQVYGNDTRTAGWLNGAKTSNCGKQLYVQRVGNRSSVLYVPIVDGCRFYTHDPSVGCFQIALTNRTFYDLHPTPKEIAQGFLDGLIWDFNNLEGDKSRNGPV